MHEEGCQYFQGGGDVEVPADDLPQAAQEVPADDLPSQEPVSGQEVPDHDIASPHDKYSTPGQQIATGVEGLAQGVGGPAATAAEVEYGKMDEGQKSTTQKMLQHALPGGAGLLLGGGLMALDAAGLNPEDIAGRKEANPGEHAIAETAGLIGGTVTGTGEGALFQKAAAKAGSQCIKNAIQGGLMQASDETSKWILGQEPQDAIGAATAVGASSIMSCLLGSAGGFASGKASSAIAKAGEEKFGQKAISLLHGISVAAKNLEPEAEAAMDSTLSKIYGFDKSAYKAGKKVFNAIIPSGGAAVGAAEGYREHGILGAIGGALSGAGLGYLGSKVSSTLGAKVVAPAVMKVLSSGSVAGAGEAFDHAASIAAGSKLLNSSIEGLFGAAPKAAQQTMNAYGSDKLKKDLDTFIGKGGINQSIKEDIYNEAQPTPQYAEGGEVKAPATSCEVKPVLRADDGLAIHYPEHNTLINTARGRVSNYLTSLKQPANLPKLPFDRDHDDREQKKAYGKALDIAVSPMSVFGEIQKGTIDTDHVKHLGAMYPELSGLLQKKLTERIVKAQLEGHTPSYKVRQGLSLLLGAPLSSEMTPQGIQAAQSSFAMNAHRQKSNQEEPKKKKSSNILSNSEKSFLTDSQAREQRMQRGK